LGNIVEVQVSNEKITLRVSPKNIVTEINNVASFDSQNGKLVSIGLPQEEFRESYPKKWKKYDGNLKFHRLFDSESFIAEAAALFLWQWWNEMIRKGMAGRIFLKSQAKLELFISFEGYELISREKRQEFEYLIFRFLFARKLSINGDAKERNARDSFPAWLFLRMHYIFLICSILFSAIPISLTTSILENARFPAFMSLALFALIILGLLAVVVYLGYVVATFLWILFLKPFFLRDILLATLQYQTSPRKNKIGRLENYLVNLLLPEAN